jgi:hypothetical protein
MTMTAEQPPRQNAQGDPCPDWCVADHSESWSSAHVSRPADAGHAWASAVRTDGSLYVAIAGHEGGTWADLRLSPHDAEQLAILAAITGASELAAVIRQAAALIAEDQP